MSFKFKNYQKFQNKEKIESQFYISKLGKFASFKFNNHEKFWGAIENI